MKILIGNKEDGLTLVELMVALSLLGIVLALGYMYFSFGVQAFDRGEERAIAQQASRLTSDFITTELRFANHIEINPSSGTSESGYSYIYLNNGSIIYRDEAENDRTLASSAIDGMPYGIYFSSNVPYDVVYFYIYADFPDSFNVGDYIDVSDGWKLNETGLDDGIKTGLYLLQTKVQALNLELYKTYSPEDPLIILNGNGGFVIKYTIPNQQ